MHLQRLNKVQQNCCGSQVQVTELGFELDLGMNFPLFRQFLEDKVLISFNF